MVKPKRFVHRSNMRGAVLINTAVIVALVAVMALIGMRGTGQKAANAYCKAEAGLDAASLESDIQLQTYYFDPEYGVCTY